MLHEDEEARKEGEGEGEEWGGEDVELQAETKTWLDATIERRDTIQKVPFPSPQTLSSTSMSTTHFAPPNPPNPPRFIRTAPSTPPRSSVNKPIHPSSNSDAGSAASTRRNLGCRLWSWVAW